MPGEQVPYPYVSGLPAEAQRELERNFLALQQQITPTATMFQAYIDSELDASTPETHEYINLTELVAGETTTWDASTTFNVGVRGRIDTPITEPTGSTTAITIPGNLYMACFGDAAYGANRANGPQPWDLNGNYVFGGTGSASHDGVVLWCHGLNIYNAGADISPKPFYKADTVYGGTLVLTDCQWDSAYRPVSSTRKFDGATDWTFYARDSRIKGNPINLTDSLECAVNWVQVDLLLYESIDFHSQVWWDGGTITGQGLTKVISLYKSGKKYINVKNGSAFAASGGASIDTWYVDPTQTTEWFIRNDGQFGTQAMSLLVAANSGIGQVFGTYRGISWSGTASKVFNGRVQTGPVDITGPIQLQMDAVLDAAQQITLRGSGVQGFLNVSGNAAPLVKFINVDYSTLFLNVRGASQPITLDSASTGNIVVLGGTDDTSSFPTAYTDAGTRNRIITNRTDSVVTSAVTLAVNTVLSSMPPAGQDGEDGEPGPAGPPGAAGAAGATGSTGSAGSTGAQGPAGNPGPPGVDGEDGSDGAPGPQGVRGPMGPTGGTGDPGPPGDEGEIGPPGPKGDTGTTGTAGTQGAMGPQGPPGDEGEKGDPGETGPQGVRGATGATGIQGTSGDPGPPGEDGEPGAPGDRGATGRTGLQGPEGVPGPPGDDGEDGKDGIQGPPGPMGQLHEFLYQFDR